MQSVASGTGAPPFKYRGCRAGQKKQSNLQIVQAERQRAAVRHRGATASTEVRPRYLVRINRSPTSINASIPIAPSNPSLYILNANSIAKPHALSQLAADLNSYQIDTAVLSETHWKPKHGVSNVQIPGYLIF